MTVFDDFLKISKDSPKLVQRAHKCCDHCPKISKDFRRLPKTVEEHLNKFKYNLGDKLDISESVKSVISSLVTI